jgi:glucose dehydrogenase
MNHRTYDGQRFSPLSRINRDNVKNLKLAFAVPLGGPKNSRKRRTAVSPTPAIAAGTARPRLGRAVEGVGAPRIGAI